MQVQIECGKITCNTCKHEMWVAPIYDRQYYFDLVCSECGNNYLKEIEEAKENIEEKEDKDGESYVE
jgi:transcription elongation factor Elf1